MEMHKTNWRCGFVSKKLIVLWSGTLLIILMCLFPPWAYDGKLAGYAFCFSDGIGTYSHYGHIDLARLIIQCVVVGLLTGALYYTLNSKKLEDNGCNSNLPCGKCEVEKQVEKEDDKGCTRREFAIWWLSLLVAVSIVMFAIGLVAPSLVFLAYIVGFIACLINLILICERLENTGHSGWWVLLLFAPIANVFLLVYCFVTPENSKFAQKNINA
jgi:hypothetical protein